jgi:hypothetical protein
MVEGKFEMFQEAAPPQKAGQGDIRAKSRDDGDDHSHHVNRNMMQIQFGWFTGHAQGLLFLSVFDMEAE